MSLNPFRWVANKWDGAAVSSTALGKYIILVASLMHVLWAVLLVSYPTASGTTPLHILVQICGGPWRTAAVLVTAASTAMFYPFVRKVGKHAFALMLIPQQTLLFLSAGAGIDAATNGQYADGVARGWPFILSDQSAIVALAILYTIAVIHAAWDDDRIVSYSG